MPYLALRPIERRHGRPRPAGGGHPQDGPLGRADEQSAVGGPRAAAPVETCSERAQRPPFQLDALERTPREEGEALTVRRPERIGGTFGARERYGFDRGELAHPEARLLG